MRSINKFAATAAVATLLSMTAACGSDDTDTTTGSNSGSDSSPSETASEEPAEETPSSDSGSDPMANLVGAGCADYAKAVPDGAGSVDGMAQDPVAVAASNNPLLKTLTAAVSGELNPDVNLVDTLNGDEFTVFAPVDEAFAAIPKKTVTTLSKDADLLSTILTYHVVPGQIAPDELAGSTQTTVQGEDVKISGSVDELEIGGQAAVICGGVQTANATVYLIDTVMMPPSMM